jgi:hypothetical protein
MTYNFSDRLKKLMEQEEIPALKPNNTPGSSDLRRWGRKGGLGKGLEKKAARFSKTFFELHGFNPGKNQENVRRLASVVRGMVSSKQTTTRHLDNPNHPHWIKTFSTISGVNDMLKGTVTPPYAGYDQDQAKLKAIMDAETEKRSSNPSLKRKAASSTTPPLKPANPLETAKIRGAVMLKTMKESLRASLRSYISEAYKITTGK